MVFRGRREERQQERETFGRGGNAVRYQIRQRMAAIGDDFWIENDRGERAYKVDGKAIRVRQTLILEDANGGELYRIQERMLRVRDTMEIEGPDGSHIATVKQALISPLRDRWTIDVATGTDLEVKGNILDHEYEIEAAGTKVAEVSKKWFRLRDSYGVEVAPGQNEPLILMIAVAIDEMANPGR